MFKDDDEEEENTFGVTRYPCMPSLVALQQMRNRLHLAYLGRKLMKWTALATGRELRRLAQELYDVYQGFGEDMRNAFIMLARSRYFCPMLNSVVTENIGKHAGVVVQQSSKTISGVKIVQFEIFETEVPPYAHLGLEKGGQSILEAKKAWLDLLKRLIMMMQLRASFLMVELANKNATKKWNVLSKLIIPRVNLSCHYIISELEEIEREDNFRLKRFKELKIKKAKGKEDPAKAGGKPCECSPNLKAKESVREAPKPVSISESNTCNIICGEHTEKKEIDSLEKSDIKLKEVCSVCETDKDKLKPNLENELDKNICVICKDMKDSKKSELDSKMPESICSNCMMQQNNKTVELKRAINSESICPACTDKMINKENTIDLTTKDSKYSKNIFDQAECLYCKNKDQTEKSKIEICKECQAANSKSQVTNIIDEKRTIHNDNLCPACTGRTINEGKDIMSQNTLEKKACIYCKREVETIDKSKMNVCQRCQINNAKKEESCPFCSKTAESTLPNKSEGQNNICVNCKKAKTDKNQLNVYKEKCLYCKKDGPNNNKPKVEVCQKCMHTKSDINNKDECLFCRKKAETNVQSKTEVCKECQAINAKSETIKDSNIRCPACKDVAMNKLSKITINKEECSYCKKRKQTIDKPQVEECKDCQVKNAKSEVKNTTDDKEGCPYCNKTKGIEFIDQRNIISPTDSTLSVLNKPSEQNKMCATCKKAEINKIQTVTSSELCQLCEENRAESNLKKEELCSECKSKNNKSHNNNKDIKKQKRQSCSTCQSPESDDDHKCHCSDSAQRKTFVKNISNTCSSCGKKSSKESFTTDTFSCSCKNDTKNKQDTLNNMSDARGTFKEIVKIKRFSGADGITHEHITVTSKKTQKRILPEPSCGKNNNNCIKDTKFHSIDLKKRNSNLKASSNIYSESSGVCLSSCSSNKNCSEISSKNNSSEIASITSRSFSCNPEGANALKKCEATCVLEPDKEYRKKETDGCVACMKSSSRMSCGKDKSHDIREVKSCPNNNNYNKIKIIIKDDKCKDNSDDEEVELTPSTIVILKKILSHTSKSADSCKSIEKENKNTNSKCSCGTQQSNSKVNTSLKIKKVKSAPCMKNTGCIDKKSSKNKKLCRTCDEQGTNSKQNKNTCNKCQKDSPEMSKQRTTAGSCQECGKKKNNNPSEGKSNCNCNKRTNCECKKSDTKVERTCSCSKKQKVTIEKTCSCNKTNSKQIPKCSSVESKHSQCCSESNETSSMANQTCLMDRLPVSKADSGTCVCYEKKPAKSKLKDNCPCSDQNQTQTMTRTCSCQSMNKNTPCSPSTNKSPECSCKSTKKIADDDDCQCAKQIQPPPKSGSCSCQSVNKNASLANKSGDCSCRSSTKDKNNDPKNNDICPCSKKSQSEPKAGTCSCQSVNKNSSLANKSGDCICKSSKKDKNSDTCSCSKQNQPQPKTSTCSCQSVNKNALCCLPSNKSRECCCKSTTKKVNDECPCSKLNAKPLTSICSCQSVNKSSQGRDCSNSVQDKSPCSCREINSKEQNTCGKLEMDTGTQQCSCSQPVKSLKSNLKFNNDPPQSLCPCKTSETGQKINKSKSCSCKSEKEIIKSYGIQGLASTSPCQASKLPSISPTHSNQSTTVASQTCCLPVDKPEKSIKFCDKASFTPNFAKSPSSISPKSSYISLRSRSSQIKSSQCSCGRKEASTMTRRTDRYDVRTLRQLTYHPESKNVSCLCKSDSALLQIGKLKNIKPLNKCQSLNNECCLRK